MGPWKKRWEVQYFVTKFCWMWCQLLVSFPVIMSVFPGDETLGRRFMTTEFLLEDLSLGK